jgi:DNA-binding FrmR family transcriptional regulator
MESERQQNEVLMRLKRIEGQVRGLHRMVEEGVSCKDIMTQVAAVIAAMKKAGIAIVQIYMEECLNKTKNESVVKRGETLKDFQEAVSRFMGWA